jgi:hypothetical protein
MRPSNGERGTETVMIFIPAKVGCDQATGREALKHDDLDSISERPQNHNPGLIHTKGPKS